MTADKIFYADVQHQVYVTDSTFIVKSKEYNITRIRNHIIKEVKPVLLPSLVLLATGVFLILAGVSRTVAFWFVPDITLFNWTINAYGWAMATGMLLFLAGSLMMAVVTMKPRYALHIFTSEGEEADVIVSPRREYLKQIIDALNRAFMLRK